MSFFAKSVPTLGSSQVKPEGRLFAEYASDHELVMRRRQKNAPGFVQEEQVRQPGADASPKRGNAPSCKSRGRRTVPKEFYISTLST
jgi:hypothetical protein